MTDQTNSPTITLTNARLLEVAAAYRALLGRTFPSATARQRAAFHFASLKPALESYDEAVKPLAEREQALPSLPKEAQDTERAAIQAEIRAFLASEVEVPRPRKLLVEADLPREAKGEDANGLVTLQLAPEFFTIVDPDAG